MSYVVVNQRLPSGPAVIASGSTFGTGYSTTAPWLGGAVVTGTGVGDGVGVGVGSALATVKSTRSYVTPAVSCTPALDAVNVIVLPFTVPGPSNVVQPGCGLAVGS